MGPVLWALMRDRYGFDASRFSREMIDDNLEGWSNIDCLGGELAKTWDGKTKITVNEHQENFNNDRADPGPTSFKGDPARALPGITSPPINESSDNWGADFVYVVGSDGLRVFMTVERGYVDLGLSPWGDEPSWEMIEEKMGTADAAPIVGGTSAGGGAQAMKRAIQILVGLIFLGVVIFVVWTVVGAMRTPEVPAGKSPSVPPAAAPPKKK
jgi:hypothetical protein